MAEADSDTETLVSDSEDKKVAELYPQRNKHRPSFTIGSDSDSTSVTSTSIDVECQNKKKGEKLKSIQSGGDFGGRRSGSPPSRGSGEYVPVGRVGYMGGSSGSRSQLNPSEVNLRLEEDGDNLYANGSSASYEEIRLFSTDDYDSKSPFTRRQWVTFVVFGFVELFSAMVISLQAPFYPLEAEKKGASATEYGLVFGIFELTVFIISPIYGSKINKIGPKLVFNLGIFITSISAIGFGFLDKLDDRLIFVVLSISIRVIEALGEAAFITASFVIIAAEFPQAVATTFAAMETFYGLGLIIGPLAGGFLYQLGGYTLPFLSVGGLLLLAAFCTTFALPSTRRMGRNSSTSSNDSFGGFKMFSLLTVPAIALSAFSIFSASASISYLNATLEPHIRQFNLTSIENGAIFIVNGGMYAISAPIWGLICDHVSKHLKLITILGCILISIGFGLIGPIPYISLETSLWGVIVGQLVQGLGLGAVLVSAFIQSLRDAIKTGLPDDIRTYTLVSGIWTSMFALGAFFGPTTAGILYDIVGFRVGTLSILGLEIFVAVLVLLSLCCECSSEEEEDDERELLFQPVIVDPVPSTSRRKGVNKRQNGSYGSVSTNRQVM